MKIEVIPGIIDLNFVRVIKSEMNLIWISCDCQQKYPVHDGTGINEAVRSSYLNNVAEKDSIDVYIGADDETLNVTKPDTIYTIIRISGVENVNDWVVLHSYRKYGADYVFVRKTGTNWYSKNFDEEDWYPGKD